MTRKEMERLSKLLNTQIVIDAKTNSASMTTPFGTIRIYNWDGSERPALKVL